MSERRSVVLALPALSQIPAILHRNNRRMFNGLTEAVQTNESAVISISDDEHGNPISREYSENNCVRGRARGRGLNHSRDCARGRGRNHSRGHGRANHDIGDPSRNSSVNESSRQQYPTLGSQANPRIRGQASSTNNMINGVEVVNLESDTDEDEAVVYGGLEDLPCWKNLQQMYGEWRKW